MSLKDHVNEAEQKVQYDDCKEYEDERIDGLGLTPAEPGEQRQEQHYEDVEVDIPCEDHDLGIDAEQFLREAGDAELVQPRAYRRDPLLRQRR